MIFPARDLSRYVRMELAKGIVETGDLSQYDEAIRILEVSIDTRPDDLGGYSTLARAYAAKQRIAEADAATAQGHMAAGKLKDAVIFAKRAQKGLDPGSRGWIKADDILKTAPREIRERGE